jgi:hypothetical protein
VPHTCEVPDDFVKIYPYFHTENSVINFTEILPEGAAQKKG